jgi:hypothetical protein
LYDGQSIKALLEVEVASVLGWDKKIEGSICLMVTWMICHHSVLAPTPFTNERRVYMSKRKIKLIGVPGIGKTTFFTKGSTTEPGKKFRFDPFDELMWNFFNYKQPSPLAINKVKKPSEHKVATIVCQDCHPQVRIVALENFMNYGDIRQKHGCEVERRYSMDTHRMTRKGDGSVWVSNLQAVVAVGAFLDKEFFDKVVAEMRYCGTRLVQYVKDVKAEHIPKIIRIEI